MSVSRRLAVDQTKTPDALVESASVRTKHSTERTWARGIAGTSRATALAASTASAITVARARPSCRSTSLVTSTVPDQPFAPITNRPAGPTTTWPTFPGPPNTAHASMGNRASSDDVASSLAADTPTMTPPDAGGGRLCR